MDRQGLQALAQSKFDDAVFLFENERYSNSYYLFGYAVELGLKARLSLSFLANTIPDRKFVNDIHTHELEKLVRLAGLDVVLREDRANFPRFDAYWSKAAEWSEQSRYVIIDQLSATRMYLAMTDQQDGVFSWLQKHW